MTSGAKVWYDVKCRKNLIGEVENRNKEEKEKEANHGRKERKRRRSMDAKHTILLGDGGE